MDHTLKPKTVVFTLLYLKIKQARDDVLVRELQRCSRKNLLPLDRVRLAVSLC